MFIVVNNTRGYFVSWTALAASRPREGGRGGGGWVALTRRILPLSLTRYAESVDKTLHRAHSPTVGVSRVRSFCFYDNRKNDIGRDIIPQKRACP